MRTSTAFFLDTGIYIRSGCFSGFIEEFIEAVNNTHGNNIHAQTYKLWAEMLKINDIERG